jgi:hypothetical protein
MTDIRYGFQGYDRDYAVESFFDNHPEFKPEALTDKAA